MLVWNVNILQHFLHLIFACQTFDSYISCIWLLHFFTLSLLQVKQKKFEVIDRHQVRAQVSNFVWKLKIECCLKKKRHLCDHFIFRDCWVSNVHLWGKLRLDFNFDFWIHLVAQVLTDLLSIMTVTNSRAPCEAKVVSFFWNTKATTKKDRDKLKQKWRHKEKDR